MANTKISQLPAKSANLATTDLVEVSEVSGLTYVSKKITGQEIIGGVASGIIEDSITDGVVNKAPSENAVFDALALKVPYTGATGDVDLGEYELKAGQIELDQSPTGTAGVAVTRWNNTIGSTETTLKGGSVVLKNGVDLVARVVNKVTPNATLTKAAYQVVRVSGAQGQRLAVAYAQANNDNNSADTLGVVIETIATNQEGFIMTVGQIEDINTSGSLQGETWADGDVLYLSPTIPGAVTKVKPTGATGHIVIIGYVEYAHAVNGKIYVKIMNGWELDELHNVYINSGTLANNDALIYESSTQLWKNKTIATALGYTPVSTTRSISTTAPLSGGGDLSADRTLSISDAAADGTTKGVATFTANDFNSASGVISLDYANGQKASGSQDGFLSASNWTDFNNKVSTGAITSSGLTMATSRLLGRTSAGTAGVEEITAGTGLTLSGGTLSVSGAVIAVGTSAVTSGTDGRVFFQAGGVVQQDANFTFDNTLKRLTLRAQGALSTDIAFRVRNSADSVTLTEIQGTGNLITRHNSSGSSLGLFHRNDTTGFSLTTGTSGYGTGNGIEVVGSTWIIQSGARQFAFSVSGGADGDLWTFQNNGSGSGKRMSLSKSGSETFCWSGENYSIGGNIWGNPPTETNSFGIKNGTAPSTNATDAFKLYSADITAGNAAPHFRTENGAIVKVYQETTAVAAATLVGGGGTTLTDTDTFDGYTLKQIVKALRNQGLLA